MGFCLNEIFDSFRLFFVSSNKLLFCSDYLTEKMYLCTSIFDYENTF